MKKIVLTGGGTAGHVTPNIALLPSLKEAGYEVFYIGSYNGIEKSLKVLIYLTMEYHPES
jgi:UDP-N-acetylglucosamine--N-acetylmuramyl-(pentapeptide) pyrophosphoryl-undecaprenol N-acetylglucosamine transferase